MKTEKEKTTLIRIDTKDKQRLESLLRYGETHADGLRLLLWALQRQGFGKLNDMVGNRQMTPLFTTEELKAIEQRLLAKRET